MHGTHASPISLSFDSEVVNGSPTQRRFELDRTTLSNLNALRFSRRGHHPLYLKNAFSVAMTGKFRTLNFHLFLLRNIEAMCLHQ